MVESSPGSSRASLPDEAVAAGAGRRRASTRTIAAISRVRSLGGTEGNEILTSAAAAVLTALLLAEGLTLLRMGPLLGTHMFVGLMLIPPVALKLGSTGYRFARYYTGSVPYREKGPPLLPLRMLAPVLVLTSVSMLATGVWLMAIGHKSDRLLMLHKVSFIVWAVFFGIHFLAYVPRVLRSLRADWGSSRRSEVPGATWRGLMVAGALAVGLALAVVLLPAIGAWHRGF